MITTLFTFFRFIFIILGSLVLFIWLWGFLFLIGLGDPHYENPYFTQEIVLHILTLILCLWFIMHQMKQIKQITKTMAQQDKNSKKEVITKTTILYRILLLITGCLVFTYYFLCFIQDKFSVINVISLFVSRIEYTIFMIIISLSCIIYQTKSIVKIIRKKKE